MFAPLAALLDDLARGRTTAVALLEQAFAAIDRRGSDGDLAFVKVYRATALVVARAGDALRGAGVDTGPLGGIPIAVKDLFDVRGDVTRAGSRSRDEASPATADAAIVARLRAAGAVLVGRTQMSEFAFSGLGLNPHDGTPRCVWDRGPEAGVDAGRGGRAPGGSSSGAGVAVALGMAAAAIGTDTGGSVRIPAAFNGLAGFKPTAQRVSTHGCFPLSTTLDSIGPIARTIDCCARLDAVLAGTPSVAPAPRTVAGLRIGVVENLFLDGLDDAVAHDFERAVDALSRLGAHVARVRFDALDELAAINAKGGFAAAESWHLHRAALERDDAQGGSRPGYDPRVTARIRRGASITAADYLDLIEARARLVAAFDRAFAGFDAWIAPTVARIPPPLAPLEQDDALFAATNAAVLRNPSAINFLDGCAATLPIHRPGAAPVGLTSFAPALHDAALLSVAAALEAVIER